MLGDQPWGPPDTYDTFNTGARLDYTFRRKWLAFAAASFSHSLIQDNVIYAYGTPFDAEWQRGLPRRARRACYFFCPDGTLRHLRLPRSRRAAHRREAEAMATGHIKTGAITQDVTVGGELFLRSVQQPGFYTMQNPYSPVALCRMARSTPTSARKTSTSPSHPLRWDPDSLENPLQSAGPRTAMGRQPSILGRHSGPGPSSRPHSAHRRRPLRFAARPQLLRLRSCTDFTIPVPIPAHRQTRLAAAICRHLQPGREPYALRQLRRHALARSAGSVVGR